MLDRRVREGVTARMGRALQDEVGQLFAVLEGVVANRGYRGGDGDGGYVAESRQRKAANGGDALGEGNVSLDPCAVYIEILREHGGAGIAEVDPHTTPLGNVAAVVNIRQGSAVLEGGSAEGGEGLGEMQSGQVAATLKGTVADLGHPLGDGDLGEAQALFEGPSVEIRDGGGDGDAFERGAARKKGIGDGRDALGEVDAREAEAALEQGAVEGLNGGGEFHRNQAVATAEGGVSDHSHALGDDHVGQDLVPRKRPDGDTHDGVSIVCGGEVNLGVGAFPAPQHEVLTAVGVHANLQALGNLVLPAASGTNLILQGVDEAIAGFDGVGIDKGRLGLALCGHTRLTGGKGEHSKHGEQNRKDSDKFHVVFHISASSFPFRVLFGGIPPIVPS